jgi:hypothetical protein
MKKPTHKERETFVADLIRHAPAATIWHATRLMRFGATYGRFQEEECNRELATWERRKEQRTREAIEDLCKQIRCKAIFGGDPRGFTVKILPPDGFTSDWGNEGIGVPTS